MKQKKSYRIVTDNYAGYQVQEKCEFLSFTWWRPSRLYKSVRANTFFSTEEAKAWIDCGCPIMSFKENKIIWTSS